MASIRPDIASCFTAHFGQDLRLTSIEDKEIFMPEQPKRVRGLVFANIAVLLFGLAGVLGKLSGLPAPLIVFGRAFFAGLVLLAVCWFRHIPLRPKRSRDSYLLLGQGVLLALHWTAFFQAINVSNVAIGLLSFSSFPLFTAMLEPLLLHQRPSRVQIVAALLILPGIVSAGSLVYTPESNDAWSHVGCAFRSLIRIAFCHESLAWTNLFQSDDQPVSGRYSRNCPLASLLLYSERLLLDTARSSHFVHSWSRLYSTGSYSLYCKYA